MYSIKVDEVNSSTTYIGESAITISTAAPFWRIRKILVTGTVSSVLWADGDEDFDNVWDDRVSLSYS